MKRSLLILLCVSVVIRSAFPEDQADWRAASPAERRPTLVAATKRGDLAAARYLVQAGMWDEMAALDPDAPEIQAWKSGAEVVDGIATAQVYAEILANWAVRHEKELGKERMQARMLEAREAMQAHPLGHPVVVDELRWLCADVPPSVDREQELGVEEGRLFESLPQPTDPLLAARWFLVRAKRGGEVNQIDREFAAAVTSAERAGDSATVAEGLWGWIKERSVTLSTPLRNGVEYDARSVVELYVRLHTVLEGRGDRRGQASAAWQCGRFLIEQRYESVAAPSFALAAKLYGELGEQQRQGRCLLELVAVLRSELFTVGTDNSGQRIDFARQAIGCFVAVKDDANLARAHYVLGDLLPTDADDALAEFHEAARIYQAVGDRAQAGRSLLAVAGCLGRQAGNAAEKKDTAAMDRIEQLEFAALTAGLELTKGTPPDRIVAYYAMQSGWLRLGLHPEQLDQAVAELREAAMLYATIGDAEEQMSQLERTAEACSSHGRPQLAQEVWRQLGDLAYGRRNQEDGPRWLDRAAGYFRKSGISDPPVKPLAINHDLDTTQGRESARLHELCQAVAAAANEQEAKERLGAVTQLLGCRIDAWWVSGLADARNSWHLATADCGSLLPMLRFPIYGLVAADLITKLGGMPAVEQLAVAMAGLPRKSETDAFLLTGLVAALERASPELARKQLHLALECMNTETLKIAGRLLPPDELKPILVRALSSPIWDVKIQALRVLNREPEALDSAVLTRLALDPIPVWGHRVEALHGLILQGKEENFPVILRLIGDETAPSEVRQLAIVGAGYLQLQTAAPMLVGLLGDTGYRGYAARALTRMGSHAHIGHLRAWLTQPLDGEFDDRHVVAHVGLWCLTGEPASRVWLIEQLAKRSQEFIAVYVNQALGWGCGQRAADLFTELVSQRKFPDNWLEPNANHEGILRSLSRLPLTEQQLSDVERVLHEPVPAPVMEPSNLSGDTIDGKPQAPLLKPRVKPPVP